MICESNTKVSQAHYLGSIFTVLIDITSNFEAMSDLHQTLSNPDIIQPSLFIKELQDHQSEVCKVIWKNMGNNSETPPPFAFQVYPLHGARDVLNDDKFPQKFWALLNTSQFPEIDHCHIQLHFTSQPSILACIENYEQRKLQYQNGVLNMVQNYASASHTCFQGFLIAINTMDWEQEGIVFTKFNPIFRRSNPKLLEPRFQMDDERDYVNGDCPQIIATRVQNVMQTSELLRRVWEGAGGFEFNANSVQNVPSSPQVKQLDFEVSLEEIPRQQDASIMADSYADYEGKPVISVWNKELSSSLPRYCYHAYIEALESPRPLSPSELFRCLCTNYYQNVDWRLDVHEYPGSLSKCMRNYVQNQRRLRDSGRAPISYANDWFQPFNDVFIVINREKYQFVSNHPISLKGRAVGEGLKLPDQLRVINVENWRRLSDILYKIWSLSKRYVVHMVLSRIVY